MVCERALCNIEYPAMIMIHYLIEAVEGGLMKMGENKGNTEKWLFSSARIMHAAARKDRSKFCCGGGVVEYIECLMRNSSAV